MKLEDERYIYETYPVYRYLNQFKYDSNFTELHEIREKNFRIYAENESNVKIISTINENLRIEELEYKSYKLIYFSNSTNVLLVNMLLKERNYPKNTSVIFFGFEDTIHLIEKIRYKNQEFNCLNVRKAFIEFSQENFEVEELKQTTNSYFWSQFKEYLITNDKKHYFGYSVFENIMIVYTNRKIH